MTRRRTFTAKFKTQVVLELLTGAKSMAHLCQEYQLKDQLVYRWKAEFLERADTIFAGDVQSQQAQERIADLERLIGRLSMELEIAKKASQLWTHERAEAADEHPVASRLSTDRDLPGIGGATLDTLLCGSATYRASRTAGD
jgi:transposase-like protein